MKIIHTEVSLKPLPSLVVAPKALTAEGDLAEVDEVKVLLDLEHVEVINHWHAEGTNRYTGVEKHLYSTLRAICGRNSEHCNTDIP